MSTAAETEIRQLIERWMQAVRDRDIPNIIAPYADDIVAFDAIQALQFKGKATYQAHWEMCMGMCPGPMVFEYAELTVHAAGDLALAAPAAETGRHRADRSARLSSYPSRSLRRMAPQIRDRRLVGDRFPARMEQGSQSASGH